MQRDMTDKSDVAGRLRDESARLSGHSLDRGIVDAGIAANLADEAADEIDRLTAALASEREARQKAEARIAKLETRLEIDRIFRLVDGEMVPEIVPANKRDEMIDGIECRDETIKLIDENNDALRARVKALEEARINREDLAYLSRMFGSVADLSINQPGYRINEWLKTLLSETA